ncbi:MAG: type II toxin-antitoxin system RelB/DinJ family antitoxin [Coriobacteriia bacterium]|nr:type II toxin-antitoxin system RelB/DinJ family antitoxin [Coriobacteriia bacterium]
MAKQSTLNIRLDQGLKKRGNEVLEREGISVSEAVRRLYAYMEREQKVPPELVEQQAEDAFARRRMLMKSMVGVLPADASLAQARQARLAAHGL